MRARGVRVGVCVCVQGNDECPHPEPGERSLCCMQSSPAVRPIVGFFVRKKTWKKSLSPADSLTPQSPLYSAKTKGKEEGPPSEIIFFEKRGKGPT